MIKRIKRLLFQIPMIPITILILVFYPTLVISSFIVDGCGRIQYRYGFILKQKFPDLIIRGSNKAIIDEEEEA